MTTNSNINEAAKAPNVEASKTPDGETKSEHTAEPVYTRVRASRPVPIILAHKAAVATVDVPYYTTLLPIVSVSTVVRMAGFGILGVGKGITYIGKTTIAGGDKIAVLGKLVRRMRQNAVLRLDIWAEQQTAKAHAKRRILEEEMTGVKSVVEMVPEPAQV